MCSTHCVLNLTSSNLKSSNLSFFHVKFDFKLMKLNFNLKLNQFLQGTSL